MVCESCVKVVSFTITFLKSIGWVAVKARRIFQVVSFVMGSRLLSFADCLHQVALYVAKVKGYVSKMKVYAAKVKGYVE